MTHKIKCLDNNNKLLWDDYVLNHPKGSLYHHSKWKRIIEETYGHKCHFLMALEMRQDKPEDNSGKVIGILPLVHIKSRLFGNSFVSMPFVDSAGVIADNPDTEDMLIDMAMQLARENGAETVEIRQREPFSTDHIDQTVLTKNHRAVMILRLLPSSDELWNSFKSKLRSQIRRPQKEGLYTTIGGLELIDDFYNVFATNMRDLGSPVHSKEFIGSVADTFSELTRIVLVYLGNKPLAGGFAIKYKKILENPWASSLNEYRNLSPNMLLYWSMLELGCKEGCEYFNFGRSTPGEGTYKFKEQWGAKPEPLYWYYFSGRKEILINNDLMERSRYNSFVSLWKRLPVCMATFLGPLIRRNISL